MKLNPYKTRIFYVFWIITIFLNETTSQTLRNSPQNEFLPDLKFGYISFEYLRHPQPKLKPDVPRGAIIRQPYALKFYISIYNRGTKDWNNNLYILYTFDESIVYNQNPILIEDLFIPHNSDKDIEVEIPFPVQRPNSITFYLNTTRIDSIEHYRIFDELYYINNLAKIELK